MNIKKLISLITAISITAILALQIGAIAYADSVQSVSTVRLTGKSLNDCYMNSNVSIVRNPTITSPAPYSGNDVLMSANVTVQQFDGSAWADYGKSTFDVGKYRLKLRISSNSGGDVMYKFTLNPTVYYNGMACTTDIRYDYSVTAYTAEFDVTGKYGIDVKGIAVTTSNSSDILGDGVFSYNAGTKTLTVNGDCTYSGIIIKNNGVDGLIINVAGASTLKATGATAIH